MFPHAFFLKALPGELDRSHLGRVLLYSGFANTQKLLSCLRKETYEDPRARVLSRFGKTVVSTLSNASQHNIDNYIQAHTLLPSMRSFARSDAIEEHGEKHLALLTRGYIVPQLRFCPACLETQCAEFGTPFWLRDHQLHGHYWCEFHRLPLHSQATSPVPGEQLPSPIAAKPVDVESNALENCVVRKYLAATLHLAYRKLPLDMRAIGIKIIGRMRQCGIRHLAAHFGTAEVALSKAVPSRWLQEVVYGSNPRNSVPLAISLTQGSKNWITFPLLAALVFDDDEMVELFSDEQS